MPHADDRELAALRRRAFSRDGDIGEDPAALARLRALERQLAPHPTEPVEAAPTTAMQPAPPPAGTEPVGEPQPPIHLDDAPTPAERLWSTIRAARRSTVILVASLLAVLAVIATTLVVVQRVQVEPLAAGTHQVARLSADRGYTVPIQVSGNVSTQRRGWQLFKGLRVTTFTWPDRVTGSTEDQPCVAVYSEDAMIETVRSSSRLFSGSRYQGCSAGGFAPAAVVPTHDDGLPRELRDAFPRGTTLEFVFDRRTDQIVVFSDAGGAGSR